MAHLSIQSAGYMSKNEAELRRIFLEQVNFIPAGERIKRCIQCGTCTGSCPVSYAMDISPRQLIALFRAGEMETIMKSRTIWICASCYACTTRCPSGIKITDIIYALKRTAMEKNYLSQAKHVQILANLFVSNLMKYGRLHEGTLIRNYYLKVGFWKLFKLIPLAKKLYQTKRLSLFPKRINAYHSLSKIIKKAQEIDLRITAPPLEYSTDYVGYRALGEMKLEQRKGE
ncbi:MAG: CoB--CoM heterodisulfide reductase subunit C [Ignavibacteriae bacterium]|nr:MAG: CoB--CoM heterodisulfide reductase subunit C [Ignavibacteriota bacterium]